MQDLQAQVGKGSQRSFFTGTGNVLGRVVRKPISANPGLKVNREFNFFYIKVFCLFMFCED